jgi:hypothetical protein
VVPGYGRLKQGNQTPDRPMTELFVVELSSWIIQDGNYGEFARGDQAAFALEFYASHELVTFEPEGTPMPSLINAGAPLYKASGQVVHVADDWWAIDVGIAIFREETPPYSVRPGSWIRGAVHVGIDPFFYFERLAVQPDAPALIYDWTIEKIEMQTAPWIEVRPRLMERDPERLGWKEIDRTDAWKDDGGHAQYLLHCKRLPTPARRTLHR